MARPRRLIVYVDGFNLYHGMHDEARCRLLWLDPVRLVRLLRPKDDLQVVRYFTAPLLETLRRIAPDDLYQSARRSPRGLIDTVMAGTRPR